MEYQIKRIEEVLFKQYFEPILALKNYSSSLHFENEEVEDFNRQKLKEVFNYLQQEKAILFGAFKQQQLIGYVWGYPHIFFKEKRMYINLIVVDKNYEGQGIGKQLLDEIEHYAKENGYDAIDLNVMPENEVAIYLYQKKGFSVERYQMRKELKKDDKSRS